MDFAYLESMLIESNVFKKEIPKETVTFIKECSKMNSSEIDYLDLDGMYWLLSSCLNAGIDIESLKNVINDKFDERLLSNLRLKGEMLCDPDEIYFGMIICDKYNVSYNKQKIINNMNNFIEQKINENFEYTNYINVRDVFFTALFAKYTNLHLNISNDCIQRMNLFIAHKLEEISKGNNGNESFSYGYLYEVYMTTKTLSMIGKTVNIQTKKQIEELLMRKALKELDNSYSNTIIAYYGLNDVFMNKKNLNEEVIEYLNINYWNKQGYERIKDSGMDDLISTYNVLDIFGTDPQISETKIEEKLVKNLRDEKNIYNAGTDSDYSRIEMVFCGIKLENLIGGIKNN